VEKYVTQTTPDSSASESVLKHENLHLEADRLSVFFPLLQHGITVPAVVGGSLASLLCDQFLIPADYVAERVTTIFLNNSPVDDLEHTIIQDGSRVTLSAAMPGLVGATMRRGGYYAALRSGISHGADDGTATASFGTVRLKLFNLLLAELGPLILKRGLILTSAERSDLTQQLPELFPAEPLESEQIFLTVTFRECEPCTSR
jgi:hypothetical protein